MNKDNVKIVETTIREFSHELKNSLTAVKGYLQLLDVKYDDVNKVKEYSSILQNQVYEIEKSIDKMYEIFLFKNIKEEKINLFDEIEVIIKESNNNKIKLLKTKEFWVFADVALIKRVFGDIINNILWEYNESGSIEIALENDSIVIKYINFNLERLSKDNFFVPYVNKGFYKTGLEFFALQRLCNLNNINCIYMNDNKLRLVKNNA